MCMSYYTVLFSTFHMIMVEYLKKRYWQVVSGQLGLLA